MLFTGKKRTIIFISLNAVSNQAAGRGGINMWKVGVKKLEETLTEQRMLLTRKDRRHSRKPEKTSRMGLVKPRDKNGRACVGAPIASQRQPRWPNF